jgi:hypothetical protein
MAFIRTLQEVAYKWQSANTRQQSFLHQFFGIVDNELDITTMNRLIKEAVDIFLVGIISFSLFY